MSAINTTHNGHAVASEYSARARYSIPANVFTTERPQVPTHVFSTERDAAFATTTASGYIELDLSTILQLGFTATTPFLLARYVRICGNESVSKQVHASGEIYYIIQGLGRSKNGSDTIFWQPGDVFCLPAGAVTKHIAEDTDAVLLMVTDEPLFAFEDARSPAPGQSRIQAVHYPHHDIQQHLETAIAQPVDNDAAGQAVQLISEPMAAFGTCLPTIALAINSLNPGSTQRAHAHNAVALTLCLQGKDCYSMVDGQRIAWQQHAVMVTPPTAVHSHHNEGDQLMRCLIAQDGGLYYHGRTVGFRFGSS